MNILNYLLQTNLYLILFMGFYTLFLRNETFFRQNRFYLNTSILLSFLIPFINSGWFRDLFITQKVREAVPVQLIYDTIIVGVSEETTVWNIADVLFWIYAGGVAILFIRFLIRLALLRSNLKVGKGSAFSFFNLLVVDRDLPEAGIIIGHEKVHMRQWHSADIILIELAAIINWFNPVMYLYKNEIRHIHEFIADEEAANLMPSKSDYALLLFSNILGIDPNQLSNNFFNKSLLKRRIIMLNKNKSHKTGLWKYGFSFPLFALMLILSAATASSDNNILGIDAKKNLPILDIISNPENNSSSKRESVSPASDQKTLDNALALKRHIERNIKYPKSARESNTRGYVMVNFTVSNNKISKVNISKSLQDDIDMEVLRVFNLYKDKIQLTDNKYSMAIIYELAGYPYKGKLLSTDTFIGQVKVMAMSGPVAPVYTNRTNKDTIPGGKKNDIADFASVEVLPEFQGGQKGWEEYIKTNLKYPEEAKKNKITGRVIMSFVVDKAGSLEDIKVLRGVEKSLDEEALRILRTSPKWKPGYQNGRPVKVAYTMPIFFQLAPKASEEKTN